MLKRNLFFLFSITLFAFASTVLNVFNYNPFESSTKIFINFYISLFVTIAGVLSIFFYYIKFIKGKNSSLYHIFWPTIRQSCIIALGVTFLLILKGLKILDIWIGIPLLIAVVLLELFFQTSNNKKTKKG